MVYILFTINYSLFIALIGLADTLIYLIRLADKLDINLITAAQSKIVVNEQKNPAEKAKGNAKKHIELDAKRDLPN